MYIFENVFIRNLKIVSYKLHFEDFESICLSLFLALPFGDTSDVLATYNAEEEEESEEGTQVYAKQDAQLYGSRRDTKQRFVSIPFMKKYIHVAKNIRVGTTIWWNVLENDSWILGEISNLFLCCI